MSAYLILTLGVFFSMTSFSKTVTKTVEYKDSDSKSYEGYLAYDDSGPAKKAGILVVHEWNGVGDHVKSRVEELAKLGFVAFAADIYGAGIRPNNPKDAGLEATKYKTNRSLLRARANLALEQLKRSPRVDIQKLAAIGFCFGGTTVLELARSGAEVAGVVTFHGGLDSPKSEDGKHIKGKVLVLHGADDPFVPEDQIKLFENEMKSNKVDWQMIKYGGAVHSFTNKSAGTDNSKGAAYNELADKRSWKAMLDFFKELNF